MAGADARAWRRLGGHHRIAPDPDPGDGDWIEPGNTVICDPDGQLVAGPLRHAEGILTAEIDLSQVLERRRLGVDTSPRPAVTTLLRGG